MKQYAIRWTFANGTTATEVRMKKGDKWVRIYGLEDARLALEQNIRWHKQIGIYAVNGRKVKEYSDDGIMRSKNSSEGAIVKYEIISRTVTPWKVVE